MNTDVLIVGSGSHAGFAAPHMIMGMPRTIRMDHANANAK
mgnify:CR=1 FL=1